MKLFLVPCFAIVKPAEVYLTSVAELWPQTLSQRFDRACREEG